MRVRQVELRDGAGHEIVVWVDASLPLTPGVEVTGKDGKRSRVHAVYQTVLSMTEINRDWRVGGLL